MVVILMAIHLVTRLYINRLTSTPHFLSVTFVNASKLQMRKTMLLNKQIYDQNQQNNEAILLLWTLLTHNRTQTNYTHS